MLVGTVRGVHALRQVRCGAPVDRPADSRLRGRRGCTTRSFQLRHVRRRRPPFERSTHRRDGFLKISMLISGVLDFDVMYTAKQSVQRREEVRSDELDTVTSLTASGKVLSHWSRAAGATRSCWREMRRRRSDRRYFEPSAAGRRWFLPLVLGPS
jgi:hypothetical protein